MVGEGYKTARVLDLADGGTPRQAQRSIRFIKRMAHALESAVTSHQTLSVAIWSAKDKAKEAVQCMERAHLPSCAREVPIEAPVEPCGQHTKLLELTAQVHLQQPLYAHMLDTHSKHLEQPSWTQGTSAIARTHTSRMIRTSYPHVIHRAPP
jgi:hypothetical protein